MKKLSAFAVFNVLVFFVIAQTPLVTPQSQYGRVYTILNTKCSSSNCHNSTTTGVDGLDFSGDSDAVYQQIFNKPSVLFPASVANHDLLANQEMPYNSFLLKKIAGPKFDTDLEIDSTGEGNYMLPVQGSANFPDTLSFTEIEVVRQWMRFGAKEVYGVNDPQPDYGTIYQYYNDSIVTPFFAKPPAPPAGKGIRLRMGPYFMATTGLFQEQEFTEQQVVYFPYLAQITELDGDMNPQSHHFLLFAYPDSAAARTPINPPANDNNGAWDVTNVSEVTPSLSGLGVLGANSFDGNKYLTGAWQVSADLKLPAGTGIMWPQKTYLDFNYHVKNYNATTVLPCDFYLNIYFSPRENGTIPMISSLINNATDLGEEIPSCVQFPPKSLPQNETWRQDYADAADGNGGTKYLWMTAGHTHQWGTGFWILRQDTSGEVDTIYNGQWDYVNNVPIGYWDHTHPPLEYWDNGLLPVYYGKNAAGTIKGGLVANTSWLSDTTCLTFGFTTANEMQLFYYMYTDTMPPGLSPASVQTVQANSNPFMLTVQPNPVNDGDGKLVYVLDNDSRVSAQIIDIAGKVVSDLTEENELAGAHQISINSTQRIASGIYLARLIVNGSPYIKKFVVVN